MCRPTDRRIKPSTISSSVAILSLKTRELQVNPSVPASKSAELMERSSSHKSNGTMVSSNRTNRFQEESWIYKTPVCTTRGVVHTTSLSPPPTPHKKRNVLVLSSSIDGEDLERLCIPDLSLPQKKAESDIPLVLPLMLLKKRPFHHIMMKKQDEESNGENVALNPKSRKLVLPTTTNTKNSKTTNHHNHPVPLLPHNSNNRSSSHHQPIMKCHHAVTA